MAFDLPTKKINRIPIKLVIDKDDLDSDDDAQILTSTSNTERKYRHRNSRVKLASEIDTGMKNTGVYIDVNPQRFDKEKETQSLQNTNKSFSCNLVQMNADKLLEKSVLQPGFEKLEKVPKYLQKEKHLKKERQKEAAKTKGEKWFNLPATEMTEEKLRDLEIIQMRSILNPKQFYKKNDLKVVPKYFQVGTVVDSPVDFYHDRVPRKERKKTLVDELMANADFQRYNKRKYAEIIQSKPVKSVNGKKKSG